MPARPLALDRVTLERDDGPALDKVNVVVRDGCATAFDRGGAVVAELPGVSTVEPQDRAGRQWLISSVTGWWRVTKRKRG